MGAETKNKEVLNKGVSKPLEEPLKPSNAVSIDRTTADVAQLPSREEARRKDKEADDARPK